jgi:hypothetical protein
VVNSHGPCQLGDIGMTERPLTGAGFEPAVFGYEADEDDRLVYFYPAVPPGGFEPPQSALRVRSPSTQAPTALPPAPDSNGDPSP